MSLPLNLTSINLHPESFTYIYNPLQNEIISSSNDCLVKFLPLTETTPKEIIDEPSEITALCLNETQLYYTQQNKLQMAKLNENGIYTSSDVMYITTMNGNKINLIDINLREQLIIITNENDDIQIINISDMKIYQYKTYLSSQVIYLKCSTDNNYLLTISINGLIAIYTFDSHVKGKITLQSKVPVTFNIPYNKKDNHNIIDTNNDNVVLIAGNDVLRYFIIDNSNSNSISLIEDSKIVHNVNIHIVKWINDFIILTCDINNVIKIWNFITKELIYEYTAVHLEDDNEIISNMNIIKLNEQSNNSECSIQLKIVFSDAKGNIHISDEIIITQAITVQDIKKETNDDIDMLDLHKEQNDNEEQQMLNLSDIEDEEGNIRNKEEIEQKLEERKVREHENNLNLIKEQLHITDPQNPFISSSTLGIGKTSRYLCFNLSGRIISTKHASYTSIDIIHYSDTPKNRISFIDTNNYFIATLNNIGAVFASKLETEDNEQTETKQSTALIEFKCISTNKLNFMNNWTYTLPLEETPILLGIGNDWCCVYTSMSYLRIISIFGIEKFTFSINTNIIAIAGYENYLAYVYHSSIPFNNSQQLRVKVLNAHDMFNQIYDIELSITPEASLIWFGFSEEGILLSYDSYNILRGYFINITTNWIPLLDLGEQYSGININYWMIGVGGGIVHGIEMKDDLIEPYVEQRPNQRMFKLIKDENEEWKLNDYKIQFYMILYLDERCKKYNKVKNICGLNFPEYYCYIGFVESEDDLKKMKRNHDKKTLNAINNAVIKGENNNAIMLFELLFLKKSKEIAIHMCNEYMQKDLGKYMEYKFNLWNINEQYKKGGVILNANSNINKNNKTQKGGSLADIALDIASYQNMEMKNEYQHKEIASHNNTNDNDNEIDNKVNNDDNNIKSASKIGFKRKHKELMNASLPYNAAFNESKKIKK